MPAVGEVNLNMKVKPGRDQSGRVNVPFATMVPRSESRLLSLGKALAIVVSDNSKAKDVPTAAAQDLSRELLQARKLHLRMRSK